MNRNFEFKQLLRAYRAGIIDEATFERELADIERVAGNGSGGHRHGFEVLGKTYGSEREAVVMLLDRFRAGEASGQAAFSGWEKHVSTECIRSGIRMITEREGYHSRIFARRLADLGAECKAGLTDFGRRLTEKLSDPKMSDNDKLLYVTSLTPDPEAFWKPVLEAVGRIEYDLESKELFKLYIQDELSSGKWLMHACETLNGRAEKPATKMGVSAGEAL